MIYDPTPGTEFRTELSKVTLRKLVIWSGREGQPLSSFIHYLITRAIHAEEERIGTSLLDVTLSPVEE